MNKFTVIPKDAYNILERRHATLEDAIAAASESVTDSGMPMFIVKLEAVVEQVTPPLKVRKIK